MTLLELIKMSKIVIQNKISGFNKTIFVDGDKSISIRSLLIGSQSYGVCKIQNLPESEDVLTTIRGLKKLGIKIIMKKKKCLVYGKGLDGYKYKKNLIINAGNSGTFARLILGLLIKNTDKIKITGDESLSRRDFLRVVEPLQKFGAKFLTKKNNGLPLQIIGTQFARPIYYEENRGSAQCKSSVILAALITPGKTIIKAKKSRNHTELFFKFLKLPMKIKRYKLFDIIEVKGEQQFKSFNCSIPGDVSSCSFFIVLTLMSKNSKLKIKDININPSRIGFINLINKMGGKIKLKNIREKNGEKIADIFVKSQNNLKGINCPIELNSNVIDEFLIIFLLASKAKGISKFSNLDELNKKESPRLNLGYKILKLIGVKTVLKNDSLKIFGNPNLNVNKNIEIKNYYKDHRIFMTSVIGALVTGGRWTIHDVNSHKSSFPSFLKILRKIGCKYKLN